MKNFKRVRNINKAWFQAHIEHKLWQESAEERRLARITQEDEDLVTLYAQAEYGGKLSDDPEGTAWHGKCYELLYRNLGTRSDDSAILEPSFCEQKRGHDGAHGWPSRVYLHPEEYPNRVGEPPITDATVLIKKLDGALREAEELIKEFQKPKPR